MAAPDILHTFLTFHLANDSTAAHHIPLVLSGLSSQTIEGSQNLSKWTNRVNALIHARDSGARWSGLCLALETSRLSRSFLLGSAQSWIAVVLPMLSVSQLRLTTVRCLFAHIRPKENRTTCSMEGGDQASMLCVHLNNRLVRVPKTDSNTQCAEVQLSLDLACGETVG